MTEIKSDERTDEALFESEATDSETHEGDELTELDRLEEEPESDEV